MKNPFDLIKQGSPLKNGNLGDIFTDIEKAKAVPIGTRVKRKGGYEEEKTASGWIRVKKESSPKSEEQSGDKNVKVNPETSVNVTKDFEKPASNPNAHPYESVRNSMSHEQLSSKVTQVVNNVSSKKGKIIELYKLGLSHAEIVNYSGAKLSDVKWYTKQYQQGLQSGAQQSAPQSTPSSSQAPPRQRNSASDSGGDESSLLMDYDKLPEIGVKDRWDTYELFGKMMCLGQGKSAIAYGTGGVGKTYTLMGKNQIFDQFKMRAFDEEKHEMETGGGDQIDENGNPIRMAAGRYLDKSAYDYVKITGKVSASEMYRTLCENNGKIVIFDDCDSVLKDDNAVNVLKGALDTSGDGTISWKVKGDIPTEYSNIEGSYDTKKGKALPKRFKFTGQVLFISNLDHKEIPQALVSRGLTIDLTMNADETSERLQQIYPHMEMQDPQGNKIDVSLEDKKAAADFIHKYRHDLDMSDLNARTLGKIALIKKTAEETGSAIDWQKAAAAMLKKRK